MRPSFLTCPRSDEGIAILQRAAAIKHTAPAGVPQEPAAVKK